jgi:hypothetical protein
MTDTELTSLADNIKGRLKFYTHGSPERRLLTRAYDAISNFSPAKLDTESVCQWLGVQGVELTPKQRKSLGIGPTASETKDS